MADSGNGRLLASAAVAAGGAAAAGKLVRDRIASRSQARERRRYRLQPGEPAGEGVRRIARGQIDLALERLDGAGAGDLDEAIHEARKALKRLRALVRLARDELGDEVYRRENDTFRDAGRALSGVRDVQVMADALGELARRHEDELPDGAFAGLHDALAAEAQAAHERIEEDAAVRDDVVGTLRATRARVDTWPVPAGASLRVLAPGFERIYRRGRRAQRAAAKDGSTEALHELRKRAKDLWYAGRVLRPAAPKPMRKLSRGAHRLSDVVGEDHDLAVLLDGARARPHTLQPGELEQLEALVARRRATLQEDALARGARLYRRKPRKIAKRVAAA
jgi:CHAD domain-containing protein